MFPLDVGVEFKLLVHESIDPKTMDFEGLVEKVEHTVTKDVTY